MLAKNRIQEYGRPLIVDFSRLVRMTGMYDSMNDTILGTSVKLLSSLNQLFAGKNEITIKMVEGLFFVEDVRIKPAVTDVEVFAFLAEELKKRSIGVLTLRAPLKSDDLVYLAYSIKEGDEASVVQSTIERKLTKGVAIGGPVSLQKAADIDKADIRAIARAAYLKAISAYIEIDNSIRMGNPLNIKKAKKALQTIIDCTSRDEAYVLGLTTVREVKTYYYQHPVNVAILATALGNKAGLNRYHLSKLTIAALLHDIGKVDIPLSIIEKKAEFSDKEADLVRRHPVEGVSHILRALGITDISVISMLVCYEHHMMLDLTGYPPPSSSREMTIFSRIVSIADDYDSMVSGKVYGRTRRSPEEVLHHMYEQSGTLYDSTLIKAFIGIFSI